MSRELHPFIGGGIAPIVRAAADQLSEVAEVTLITTAANRATYEQLVASGPLYAEAVRVVFVDEPPEGPGNFYSWLHAWSHRVFEALRETFPERGPDLVEFPDYLAEGFVTIQGKRTAEPFLRDTLVCVRLHTTTEIVGTLNGFINPDFETRAIHEMERYCLRRADRLLWPGGDVLGTYQRFYGADGLAPATEIPDAFFVHPQAPAPAHPNEGPLKLLYLGRMERRKGVQNLLRALLSMEFEDWRLSLVGGDTATGPLGISMRGHLWFMGAEEGRIEIHGEVPREQVGRLILDHDIVVLPSLWECWPNVAREAFLHDRPVVATPVGGLVALVRPGVSGWLARDAGVDALRDALEPHVRDPSMSRALGASGGPRAVLAELTDPDTIRSRYLRLIASAERTARPTNGSDPLVSVVIPYHAMADFVEDALRSVADQTYRRIETVVVNDGSMLEADQVLEELAERYRFRLVTQRNRGLGAARNFGVANARGRFVLPLDADDALAPDFVARAVDAIRDDDDLAYVGAWSTYVDLQLEPIPGADPGYAPFGNWSALTEVQNVAGSATALLRRSLFDLGFSYSVDLTSYEDWLFYLELRHAGHFGAIIPKPLLRYRLRPSSMLRETGIVRRERLAGEVAAHVVEGAMQWTPRNA